MPTHEQATVNPHIPHALVTEADKTVLRLFGYDCKDHGFQGLFFFMPESQQSFLNEKEAAGLARIIEESYPDARQRPDWVVHILLILESAPELKEIDLEDYLAPEQVFQGMMSKPANQGDGKLIEIEIMGSRITTGHSLSMGAFSGWVCIITEKATKFESTRDLARRLRRELAA